MPHLLPTYRLKTCSLPTFPAARQDLSGGGGHDTPEYAPGGGNGMRSRRRRVPADHSGEREDAQEEAVRWRCLACPANISSMGTAPKITLPGEEGLRDA